MGGGTGISSMDLGCSKDEDGDGLIPVIGDVGDITGAGGSSGAGTGGGTSGVGIVCTRFRGVCLRTGPPP